jgi:hypothetical protein
MESVIKWQTGEPKEEGDYLVSLRNGCVRSDGFVLIATLSLRGVK